jgi:hypothetical protein
MPRMSTSHIAMLLAIGAIVPMQSLALRPGLAETLGNGQAPGFAAIAISDSAAGAAGAIAVGGIAIGPDSSARTQNATQPCTSPAPFTDCGHGNIAIGITSGATNDFAVAVGFLSGASGINSSAIGANSKATGANSSAFGSSAKAVGSGSFAAGFDATANGIISVAIGNSSVAADGAVALGSQANASGGGAIAMGQGPRRPANSLSRPVLRPTPRETTP